MSDGDDLPRRLGRRGEPASASGSVRARETRSSSFAVILAVRRVGPAIAAHVEQEDVERRAVGDVAIERSASSALRPHRRVVEKRAGRPATAATRWSPYRGSLEPMTLARIPVVAASHGRPTGRSAETSALNRRRLCSSSRLYSIGPRKSARVSATLEVSSVVRFFHDRCCRRA